MKKSLTWKNVRFLLEIRRNLLLVSALGKSGLYYLFKEQALEIIRLNERVKKSGKE